jgi:glycosyltransferase involved in cell wall biosynthesis
MDKVKSILWSSRDLGGAEIYVRLLSKLFGIKYLPLNNLSILRRIKVIIEVIFSRKVYVLHDLRAGLLVFLRPFRKDVVVIHGPGKSRSLTKLFCFAASYFAKTIVLVSDDLPIAGLRKTYVVVPNFSDAGINADINSSDAIFFGRVEKSKRIDVLVNYWSSRSSGGILHVVGDGALLAGLRDRYSGSSNVKFHGKVSHSLINTVASKCRYYVSLSDREGTSLSLIESMAGGLIPVVMPIPSQYFISRELNLPMASYDIKGLEQVFSYYDAMEIDQLLSISKLVSGYIDDNYKKKWVSYWGRINNE